MQADKGGRVSCTSVLVLFLSGLLLINWDGAMRYEGKKETTLCAKAA